MKTTTIVGHLQSLWERSSGEDFTSRAEDRALAAAIKRLRDAEGAYKLSVRELDTILAALRYWQRPTRNESSEENLLASEHGEPLDRSEIDELCERLNCGGD